MRLGLGLGMPYGGLRITGASLLLAGEADGLAMDFTDLSARVKDTATPDNNFSGNVNNLLAYTSPSAKYIRGRDGIFTSGTTIRTEYDVNGVALGARIESARTNLALRSALQGAVAGTPGTAPTGWGFGSSGGSTAVASAGNKLSGLDALEFTCASGARHFLSQGVTTTAATYTYSTLIEVISGTAPAVNQIVAFAGFTGIAGVTNRVNGVTTTTIGGPGLYFIETVVTFDAGDLTGDIRLGLGTSGNLAADCSIRIHYVQLELGSFATSPIVTAGSTVTRAGDLISILTSAFPYSATAGSYFISATIASGFFASGNVSLLSLDDDTANEIIHIRSLVTTGAINLRVVDGGAQQANTGIGASITADTLFKAAGAWAANDFICCANGTLSTQDTSGTLPTPTLLQIGESSPDVEGVIWVKKVDYLPRRRTDAELQTRTT